MTTMFHVKQRHYIRTDLTVPGSGSAIHVAELEEIDRTSCTMVRIIELAPDEAIMGAHGNGKSAGNSNQPNAVVPHPDTYDDFPDIDARRLSQDEFEALWNEALTKFPELS